MKASVKELPSQEELQGLFECRDGQLFWKQGGRGRKVDRPSGSVSKDRGYRSIKFGGVSYYAHRLVYKYHHGALGAGLLIDHINGNKDDNRIENLRLVTPQENTFNQPSAKGYSFNERECKWKARIEVDGKEIHLGSFGTEAEACAARAAAKTMYHQIVKH